MGNFRENFKFGAMTFAIIAVGAELISMQSSVDAFRLAEDALDKGDCKLESLKKPMPYADRDLIGLFRLNGQFTVRIDKVHIISDLPDQKTIFMTLDVSAVDIKTDRSFRNDSEVS